MKTNISPLSGENARHLLRRAMEQEPGPDAQERVAARLEQSIALGLVPASTPGTACEPAPTATNAPLGPLMANSNFLLGITLLAGVGMGVGVDRWVMSRSPHHAVAITSANAPSEPAALVLATGLDSRSLGDTMPTVRAEDLPKIRTGATRHIPTDLSPAPGAHFEPAGHATQLPEERGQARDQSPHPMASLREQQALLDQARLALGKGQSGRCLDALTKHRNQFPQSLLAEERDALAIKALAASGKLDAAREQAAAFLTSYPRSMLIPSVESTVGKIPR